MEKLNENYLKFTALEDSTLSMTASFADAKLSYSYDKKNWVDFAFAGAGSKYVSNTISIEKGKTVFLKGDNLRVIII